MFDLESPEFVVDDEPAEDGALSRAAWARLRWPGAEVIDAHQLARLDEPVHAGSLFKVIAARAAIEQGLITADTQVACPRRVDFRGRRLDCVHPDLGRPLALDDALAHSCNNWFVRLAERLDREGLSATLRRVSGGAAQAVGDQPLPLIVLGLEGQQLGLRTWLRAVLGALEADREDGSIALLRRGARRAATEGSASALADPSMLTFAKTGTTMPASGPQEGRVVAWRPELGEAIVVRAAGVPGRDAARVARAAWDRAAGASGPPVRVGRLRDHPGTTTRIDAIALEEYVASVVAGEGEPTMPRVALQALAVAARSYASAPDGRHARDGFDMCDTTHCQVMGAVTTWSRDAARSTAGMVLARAGRVVAVPYSAACSGDLVSPRVLWGGADAVISATGPDPGVHDVPTWSAEVRADKLHAVLRTAGRVGDVLRDVRVVARTRDGVPMRIALDGLAPGDIDATEFRHLVGRGLGWDLLKSHAWQVTRSGRGYRFSGRGKGHGAGLCVRGAAALAERGRSLEQVLSTYVPGAAVSSTHDRVTLRVPGPLIATAPQIQADVRRSLAELRQRLAVTTPREIALVIHPTRQAYQRATGRAWWTSGSTHRLGHGRYRIDVATPADPQAREQLNATLRHEFVHVLTGPGLANADAWVVEGLAARVAHDPVHAHARAVARPAARPCPPDAEVLRPGSLEAMRAAYARAEACVAVALPAGPGEWRALAK